MIKESKLISWFTKKKSTSFRDQKKLPLNKGLSKTQYIIDINTSIIISLTIIKHYGKHVYILCADVYIHKYTHIHICRV